MVDLKDFAKLIEENNNNINMMKAETKELSERIKNMYNDKYIPIYELLKEMASISDKIRSNCPNIYFRIPSTNYVVNIVTNSSGNPELGVYGTTDPEDIKYYNTDDKSKMSFIRWITLCKTYKQTIDYCDREDARKETKELVDSLIIKWDKIENTLVSNWKEALTNQSNIAIENAKINLNASCAKYENNYNLFH